MMSFGMMDSICGLFFMLNLIVMAKSVSVSINENAAVGSGYNVDFGTGTTNVAFKTKPTEFDLLSNGTLVVKSMLDYETKTVYNYDVLVTTSAGTKTEKLTITINDINDMAPTIVRPIKPTTPYPLGLPANATAVMYKGLDTRDGAVIYCVKATDVDTNANLTFDFFPSEDLDANTKNNFRIVPDLGCIVRKGNDPLPSSTLKYEFPIRVRDGNSAVAEKSAAYVTVTAYVNPQNPQIGANPYVIMFPEKTPPNTKIGSIGALPLTNIYAKLTYALTPLEPYERPWPFTFDTTTGELTVTREFIYNVSCKYEWHANVTVTESSTLSSHAKVSIVLGDTNDHRPIFQQSVYFNGKPVREDVGDSAVILNVPATDPDNFYPTNLKYSLHGAHSSFFQISTLPSSTVGMIKRVKPLDYEALGSTKAYEMTVSVTDGIGAAATASVVIYVLNVNDNAPKFSSSNESTVQVQRKLTGQVVFQAHAYDADGSTVEYYFKGKQSSETYFSIDKVSGAVTYTKEAPSNVPSRKLEIYAHDSRDCTLPCIKSTNQLQSTLLALTVKFLDKNTVAPNFTNCLPILEFSEALKKGDLIHTIKAVDTDLGLDSAVFYELKANSFTENPGSYVTINSSNGEIRLNRIFDREKDDERYNGLWAVWITVMARDSGSNGTNQLRSYCTMRIKVNDVNDNPPVFDNGGKPYVTGIFNGTQTSGTKVTQVFAIDPDEFDTPRSKVTYGTSTNFPTWLAIDSNTGWLTFATGRTSFSSPLYEFSVTARNNEPMHASSSTTSSVVTATVRIYVVNQQNMLPPTVTMPSDSISIKETDDGKSVMNGVVTLPGGGNFDKETIPGSTTQTNKQLKYFRILRNGTSISIRKVGNTDATYLDHVYFLARITRVGSLYGSGDKTDYIYTDVRVLIKILDVNNKIPSFIIFGIADLRNRIINMPENMNNTVNSGNPVATLFAADKDVLEPNRKITYSIKPHPYFTVVGSNLYVRNNVTGFDFEGSTRRYTITVIAEDGAPSVLPGIAPKHNSDSKEIHVTITDVNDLTPYFPSTFYNISVKEDVIVGETFHTLKAIDHDTVNQFTLTYSMDSKNTPFGIDAHTGKLYATRPLDYEGNTKVFNFKVKVFDGKFSNFTDLRINILDVNDNPPTFNDAKDGIIETPSFDVGSAPSPLLRLNVTDKDKGSTSADVIAEGHWVKAPTDYFSVSTTRDLTVVASINPAKNVLRSDRKYHFTLKAVDGTMTSYAQVVVTVTNPANLAPPCFDMATLNGFQVVGNTFAMRVAASDPDGTHISITYSISGTTAYTIDSTTGVVSSTTAPSASATGSLHTFSVTASDGTKTTTGLATVTVIGKNELNPKCTKSPYKATYDDQVKMKDVFYAVKAGDLFPSDRRKTKYSLATAADREYFGIRDLPALDAGGLFLIKALPNMNKRTVTVTVSNAVGKSANCSVEITPTDGNSHNPNIYATVLRSSIPESTGSPTVLTTAIKLVTFKVNDTDTKDTEFVITMSPTFDVGFNPGLELNQNSGTQAELFLLKSLDRERLTTGSGPALVRAVIHARDKTWKYRTATTTFTLTVTDSAEIPTFPTDVNPYVNVATGANAPVVPATFSAVPAGRYTYATDTTSPVWSGSNQPFKFTTASDGKSFSLSTARNLASDQGNSITVPIRISSGTTGNVLTTATLTVGFQTGKLQNTDKQVSATVSYGWSWYWTPSIRSINLGSIYALRLYGSDATGVTYTMKSNPYPNYFRLNTTTGNVLIIGSTPAGNYTVTATVKRGSESVTATMNIEATAVGLHALENVATLRLNNINVNTLVTRKKISTSTSTSTVFQPSILDQIRTKIAQLIPTTANKVQVVSVVPDTRQNAVDVYYVASGSPYFTIAKLNTLLLLNKAELEKIPGVTVGSTPIDKCAAEPEKCPNGCTNQIRINQESAGIDREPSSTVLGLKVTTEAVCGCGIPSGQVPPGVCTAGSCLNEGNCSVVPGTKTTTCKCPATYEGPRCQQLYVNFGSADGYIFSEPVGACGDLHINFDFVTKQTGRVLLLYTGPLTAPLTNAQDRLSVELSSGVPIVTITVNNQAPQFITVSNPDPALNDGQWHRLDIWYKNGKLQVMIDRCLKVPLHQYDGSLPTDRSRCFSEKTIVTAPVRPTLRRLNGAAYPLQVGGSVLTSVFPTGLLGGIGYLRVNGVIRNLVGTKQSYNNKVDTNTAMTRSCYSANKTPVCGVNSLCRQSLDGTAARCTCKFGYRKDASGKCTVKTKIVDYRSGGYTLWKMKTVPTNTTKNRVDFGVMFRTRRTFGTIMYLMGSDFIRNQSLELRIVNSQVVLTINIGDFSFRDIVVPNKNVSDGAWHSVEVQRSLNLYEVLLDGGDMNNYAYYEGSMTSRYNYMILNQYVLSGLRVNLRSPINFEFTSTYNSLNDSCFTDARLDGGWLPFKAADDNLAGSVATVFRKGNRGDGCANTNVCPVPDTCVAPLICTASIWRPLTRPSCSCGTGSVLLAGFCIPVGVCSPNPCFRGVCSVTSAFTWGYQCKCPAGYSGRRCGTYVGASTASLDGGIIALIVIVILLIIIAILLYCFCVRRKRGDKLLDYPDEDTRENVCHYDEEGAGEEDHGGYDLTDLRKPIHDDIRPIDARHLKNAPPHDNTDLGHFLDGKLKDAEKDPHGPPQDYSLDYGYEGQGSVVDDLSSLGSGTSDGSQHYDHLDKLGPKFKPLHELYNHNHKA